jgi:hypothetical protein
MVESSFLYHPGRSSKDWGAHSWLQPVKAPTKDRPRVGGFLCKFNPVLHTHGAAIPRTYLTLAFYRMPEYDALEQVVPRTIPIEGHGERPTLHGSVGVSKESKRPGMPIENPAGVIGQDPRITVSKHVAVAHRHGRQSRRRKGGSPLVSWKKRRTLRVSASCSPATATCSNAANRSGISPSPCTWN